MFFCVVFSAGYCSRCIILTRLGSDSFDVLRLKYVNNGGGPKIKKGRNHLGDYLPTG